MRIPRFSRVLLTGLLLTAGLAEPVRADVEPLADLHGPDVVRYPIESVLSDARRLVVQGDRTPDGGCAFTATETAAPDSGTLRGQELAFDLATCRSLIEVGVPTGALPEEDVQIDPNWTFDVADYTSDPNAVDVTPQLGIPEEIQIPLTVSSRARALHTWFRDPPGIHVNDATNTVTWAPSATCAFPQGSSAKASGLYQWFALTGWSFRGRTWSPSFNCTAVTSKSSNIKFRNRAFCAAVTPIFLLFPTDTTLNNQIRGLPGGNYDYTYSWSKSGPCSVLLSFGWEVYVP